jgi:hypothetical protein
MSGIGPGLEYIALHDLQVRMDQREFGGVSQQGSDLVAPGECDVDSLTADAAIGADDEYVFHRR